MNLAVVKTPGLSGGVWVIKSSKRQIVYKCIIMAFSRILICVCILLKYLKDHWQNIVNVSATKSFKQPEAFCVAHASFTIQ